MEFRDWLQGELNRREWRATDLARKADIDNGMISRILSGAREPSVKTLEKIADAFSLPVDEVMQRANILPPKSERSQLENELLHNFDQLDEDGKAHVITIVRALADSNAKGRKKNHRGAAEAIS